MICSSFILLCLFASSLVSTAEDSEYEYSKDWQCPNGNCVSFDDSDTGRAPVEIGPQSPQSTPDQKERLRRSPEEGADNTCVLPSHPRHGSFIVIGEPNGPDETYDVLRLNITCHPGYSVVGKSLIFCISGIWSDEMPKCVRSCRLDKHPSVNYKCVLSGNKFGEAYRECYDYEPIGVVVKPECNAPNYYNTGVLSRMHCTKYGWDYIALCSPECGRVTAEGQELVIGGKPAERGEFPWHAGIYRKTTTPYEQICGGSLVSSSVVISAAHCFWNRYTQKQNPASHYAVAVGKLYRPWNDSHDVDAQKSDVNDIVIPVRFQGAAANFQDDVAVLVLATAIKYQTYVRPVCVDLGILFEKRHLQDGNMGKVAGWGLTAANGPASSVLKVASLPYVPIARCIEEAPAGFKEFLTSDKICAGSKLGTALCKGDSGGGLVFPESDRGTERFYLRGIVSTAPSNEDACNALATTSFTQLTSHKSFIEDNIVLLGDNALSGQSTQAALCVLPPYPNHGGYVVSGTPNVYPGQAFSSVQISITCDHGYEVEGNSTMACNDGRWSKNVPRCVRMCTIDKNPSFEFRCYDEEKQIFRDCNDLEPSGSVVDVFCGPSYYTQRELGDHPTMKCVEGAWDTKPEPCKPACGVVTANSTRSGLLVEYQLQSQPQSSEGLFPWYAIIYLKQNNESTEDPKYICGGTLVYERIVISAAHCFWSEAGTPRPETDYVVAVGKTHIAWNDSRDPGAQTSNVYYVRIPSRFRGTVTNYQNDIAMIMVETPFKKTQYVMPVCLDFNFILDRTQLQPGKTGKVATWQNGAKGDKKGVLQTLAMANVEIGQCIEVSEDSFKAFITSDKICATRTNGTTGLCKGDSGSGLVFPETYGGVQRYYLRGVASVTPYREDDETCSRFIPAVFTQILPHEHFINDNLGGFSFADIGEQLFRGK